LSAVCTILFFLSLLLPLDISCERGGPVSISIKTVPESQLLRYGEGRHRRRIADFKTLGVETRWILVLRLPL
jgi:hypothetical protein